ncbi:hypothetical protein SmJEL517_g01624 [Synchytrium microbalum]|uniref:RRM domain-containing protein n=1 Tax=Synchytrium microbalum TaxID=1806994 RepID=A0A507CFE5_9FUNG|nr:uncharacterized protein SmJEL517_g01624 [Synchytrium microbalum]TPX36305.1 hypothetical protein SmJEL517_g01624 [Synchytrium microbalum]
MTVAPSVATNTLHVTYDPRLTDRGDLYVTFRGLAGFELVGLYESYLFVRFETPVFAALALCKPRPVGVITYEAAKHRYTIPYPQPQDDNDGPCAVLHITHMPSGWTQVEMTKIFQLFDGFVRATFHEKYSYCHFLTHEAAARARKELRCSTNLVVSFAKVFKEQRIPMAPQMDGGRPVPGGLAGQTPRTAYPPYSPSMNPVPASYSAPPRFLPRQPYISYELASNGYTTPPPYDLYSYRSPTHTIHRAHSASSLNHLYRRQYQLRTPPEEADDGLGEVIVHDDGEEDDDHLEANNSGDSILVDLAAELDTMSTHDRPDMTAYKYQQYLYPTHHSHSMPRKGSFGASSAYNMDTNRWSAPSNPSSASSSPLRSEYPDYDFVEREIVYGHHRNMPSYNDNLHVGRMRYRKTSDPLPARMDASATSRMDTFAIGSERARNARMSSPSMPNGNPGNSHHNGGMGTPSYLLNDLQQQQQDGRRSIDENSMGRRISTPQRERTSVYGAQQPQQQQQPTGSSRSSSPSSTSSNSSLQPHKSTEQDSSAHQQQLPQTQLYEHHLNQSLANPDQSPYTPSSQQQSSSDHAGMYQSVYPTTVSEPYGW